MKVSHFTLTLLVKVLASKGVAEGVLSITAVYDAALQLLLRYDLQKVGGDADMEASVGTILRTVCIRHGSLHTHLSDVSTAPFM